ncbi:MAG: hypothetical protein GWP10_13395 [Nitrospiraceae bacterium]|nr:hypothetical protein [Nitrospiraceae bacterium]
MFLKIRRSKYMDMSTLGNMENYIARIPKAIRKTLNLKYGSYVKFVAPHNKSVILQVNPAYNEDIKLIPNFYGVFVTSYVAEQLGVDNSSTETINKLTLGMDPEAFVVNEHGQIVDASNYFNEFKIGADCGLLEFRPNPELTPQELVNNLYKLMITATNKLKPHWLDIIAASSFNFKPAGFHIHFGYNCGLKKYISQIKLVGALLDYVVGVLALTKEIREDKFRRGSSTYGKPGDIRRSKVSFEYRVPGGRMLESPILAIGITSIAEIAVKDFLRVCNNLTDNLKYPKKFETYKQLMEMYPLLPSKDIIYEILTNTNCTKIYVNTMHDNIIKTIQNFDEYENRKKEIEMFLDYKSTYMENNLINHWKSEYEKLGEK